MVTLFKVVDTTTIRTLQSSGYSSLILTVDVSLIPHPCYISHLVNFISVVFMQQMVELYFSYFQYEHLQCLIDKKPLC